MRALLVVCLVLVTAAVAPPAGGKREADLLVRHGESIGKVKLGMTLPQVRALLGRARAVNKREKRGTRAYVYLELDWDFARWTVGFMGRPGGTYRAVSIATVLRTQRTPEGLGVGSSGAELFRKLRDLRCRQVDPAAAATGYSECVYGQPGRKQTVFVKDKWGGRDEPVGLVALVEVRAPLFYRGWPVKLYPCPFDC